MDHALDMGVGVEKTVFTSKWIVERYGFLRRTVRVYLLSVNEFLSLHTECLVCKSRVISIGMLYV